MKNIKNIGKKTGKLLIFGGVYSNFQALQKMQSIVKELEVSPENVFCTGDVVGYCAQPEECLQSIKAWGIHCIAGNVELQLAAEDIECGCNFSDGSRCDGFSKMWYPYAQNRISDDSLKWMQNLPEFIQFEYNNLKVAVLHGSFFNTSEFIFKSNLWEVKERNFEELKADLILAGHCGIPFESINMEEKRSWINAGVIGMPANDGSSAVWYLTIDADGSHKFHTFDYDFETAAKKMEENALPNEYAHTLRTGLWDNCEILPETETALQGLPINLQTD